MMGGMERRREQPRTDARPCVGRLVLVVTVLAVLAGLPLAAIADPASAATLAPAMAWTSPADQALAVTASDTGSVALVVRAGQGLLVGLDGLGADRWTTPVSPAPTVSPHLRTGPDGTVFLTADFEGTITLGRPGASITLQGVGTYIDNWGSVRSQSTPVAAAFTPTGDLQWAVAGTSSNPGLGNHPSGDLFGPALGDGNGGAWFEVATNGTLAIAGTTYNGGQAGIYVAHVTGAGVVDAVAQFAQGPFPAPGEVYLVGGDVVLSASFVTYAAPPGTPAPTMGLHADAVALPSSGPFGAAHAVARLHPDSGVVWVTPLTSKYTGLGLQRVQAHADGTVTLAVNGGVQPPGPLSSITVGTGPTAMTDAPMTNDEGFLVRLSSTGAPTWIRHEDGQSWGADIRPDGSVVWNVNFSRTLSGRAPDGTEQWRYDLADDGLSETTSYVVNPVAAGGPAPLFLHSAGIAALTFTPATRDLRTTVTVPASLELGTTVTATVTVTNTGRTAADGVVAPLTLEYPGTFTVALADVSTAAGSWVDGNWTIGRLDPGASAVAHLTLTPVAGAPAGSAATLVVAATADPTTPERNPADDTARATVTLTTPASADVAVSADLGPTTLTGPSSTPIRFRATNNGLLSTTVTLQPSLTAAPEQATTVAWGPASAGTLGAASTWTVALAPGQSADLNGSVTVGATAQPGQVSYGLCRTASSIPDPGSANDCATVTATVTVTNAPGLQITTQPATVTLGQLATYQVTVTNAGPGATAGGAVTLSAPRALTSSSGSGGFMPTATGATWTLPPIAAGGSVSRWVQSDTTTWAPLTALTLSGTLTVAGDTTANDNTASATASLATADVTVTATPTVPGLRAGTSLWVAFNVTNHGVTTATVTVTPSLTTQPDLAIASRWTTGSSVWSADPPTGPWGVTLPAGTTYQFGVWVGVPADTIEGTIQIGLCRTASTPTDPEPSNDCASATLAVIGISDLAVTVQPETTPVAAGQTASWTVTVTNLGPAAATDPRVTATATGAAGDHPIDSTTGDGTATPGAGAGWEWAPGPLAAGASATRTFTADSTAWVPGETVTLTGTATATGPTSFDPTGRYGNSTAGAAVTRDAPAVLPDVAQQLPNVEITGLTHDAAGRLAVVGTFARPVTIGTGPDARSLVPAGWLPGRRGSTLQSDTLVAVFETDGRLAWVSTVTGRDVQQAVAVGTDAAGNVYVIGANRNISGAGPTPVRFGSGPWTDVRSLGGTLWSSSTFLAAWSPEGRLLWDRVLSDPTGTCAVQPGDLAVAPDGQVALAARTSCGFQIETGTGPWRLARTSAAYTKPPNTGNSTDVAVVWYDRNGTLLRQHRLRGSAFMGGPLRLAGRPDGSIVLATTKDAGSVELYDLDSGTPTVIAQGWGWEGWLVGFDRDGNRQWATASVARPVDVTATGTGDLWLLDCLRFSGWSTGCVLEARRLAPNHGGTDVLLPLGFQTLIAYGYQSLTDGGRIDHDDAGNVVVTGSFDAELALGSPVGWVLHPVDGLDETFTASFDRTGAVRWASRQGRTEGYGSPLVTVLPNGSVVTALPRSAAATGLPVVPTFGNQPGATTMTGIDGTGSVLVRHGPAMAPATGRITGTTTDATTALPVAGLRVDLIDAYPSGRIVASTTSAADGTFSFDGVALGGYRLRAADSDPTYETTWVDAATAYRTAPDTAVGAIADTAVTIAVRARGTASITGTLTRTDTTGPLDGARVLLFDDQGYRATTTSAPDGTYRFDGLHAGDYRIRVIDTGPCGCAPTWIGGNPLGATTPLTVTDAATLTADAALHPLRADLGVVTLAAPTVDATGTPTAAVSMVVGVANTGPDTSRTLLVHLTLPADAATTALPRATADRGRIIGDTWYIPALAPGQTARLALTTDPLPTGTHTFTATMNHPAMDTNTTNDTSTATLTIP